MSIKNATKEGEKLDTYNDFAQVYDLFMEDIPYDEWVSYLEAVWRNYDFKPKLIAELGCGTGNITHRLAKKGYDMIGIDVSDTMLLQAREKAVEENQEILYLLQDMREFELYGTVDCIISLCDSLNYITDENDLLEVFRLADNYLEPNGLFIFDMNTEYKFKEILGNNTFAEAEEEAAYIWENFYDEEEKINEYYVSFFVRDKKSQMYRRFEEEHYEKAYSLETVKKLLNKAGLKFLAVYDAFTFDVPKAESERVYFIAQEIKKNKK